jgi:hypothetical protein
MLSSISWKEKNAGENRGGTAGTAFSPASPSGAMGRDVMTAKKTAKERPPAEADPSFAPVVDAFATDPCVSRGKMMSSYGLKVNGKIFAMFGKGKFVAKLPKKRVDELVSSGKGERFDPGHGRRMKEWVSLTAGRAAWVELSKEAYEFVKKGPTQ